MLSRVIFGGLLALTGLGFLLLLGIHMVTIAAPERAVELDGLAAALIAGMFALLVPATGVSFVRHRGRLKAYNESGQRSTNELIRSIAPHASDAIIRAYGLFGIYALFNLIVFGLARRGDDPSGASSLRVMSAFMLPLYFFIGMLYYSLWRSVGEVPASE